MSLSVLDSAKYLLENSRATVTQVELQKLLYLAQMRHLGEYDRPMVASRFEAWEIGPVSRILYNELTHLGANPIPSTAVPGNRDVLDALNGTEKDVLDRTVRELSGKDVVDLMRITHWEDGAWAKTYNPKDWSIEIPESLMRQEYLDRMEIAHASITD